jgi:hypothetical protein
VIPVPVLTVNVPTVVDTETETLSPANAATDIPVSVVGVPPMTDGVVVEVAPVTAACAGIVMRSAPVTAMSAANAAERV